MLNSRLFGGILLVAGTTIGAAMLALPLSTGLGGFFPALGLFTLVWAVMLWVGYLIVEVNLAYEGDVNFVTMVRDTLGPVGEFVTWLLYLGLFYSLLAAYISGSGPLFLDGIQNVFSLNLPNWTAPFWVLILFCPFLYAGLKAVDNINRVLMILMGVAFVLMLGLLFGHVDANLLAYTDTSYTLISLSVVITSFGYHVIIPSLTTYLDRDLKQIKLCVLLGSSLPFVIYFAWELVILGTIPVAGEFGIAEIIKQGIPVSKSLSAVLNNSWVTGVVAVFAICAIVTSFLGVAQGLIDFLKDGFKVNHDSHAGHIGVFLAAFVPPLAFALFYPQGFIMALEWAGIFVAILLGLIPILMVWSLRYVKKIQTSYRAFGNRLFLSLGMLFFVFIVGLVFAKNLGFLN